MWPGESAKLHFYPYNTSVMYVINNTTIQYVRHSTGIRICCMLVIIYLHCTSGIIHVRFLNCIELIDGRQSWGCGHCSFISLIFG